MKQYISKYHFTNWFLSSDTYKNNFSYILFIIILTKYYLDTERTKTEGLIFCNKWGSLTSENSKKPEYLSLMNSMHVFESLRKDLELKKQPVFQEHQQIDLLNLTFRQTKFSKKKNCICGER